MDSWIVIHLKHVSSLYVLVVELFVLAPCAVALPCASHDLVPHVRLLVANPEMTRNGLFAAVVVVAIVAANVVCVLEWDEV